MADAESRSGARAPGGPSWRALRWVVAANCASTAAALVLMAAGPGHDDDVRDWFGAQAAPDAATPSPMHDPKRWVQLVDGVQVSGQFQVGGRTMWLVSEPGGLGCLWLHRLLWQGATGMEQTTLEQCSAYAGTIVRNGQLTLVFRGQGAEGDEATQRSSEVEEQLVPMMRMSAPAAPARTRPLGRAAS